jgi:hypothetical protein
VYSGSPELSDPVGPLEVGEREDVEQFGAGSGAERVEAFPESALKFIGSHQVSAMAAWAVTAWTAFSRNSRSRRAMAGSPHPGHPDGVDVRNVANGTYPSAVKTSSDLRLLTSNDSFSL